MSYRSPYLSQLWFLGLTLRKALQGHKPIPHDCSFSRGRAGGSEKFLGLALGSGQAVQVMHPHGPFASQDLGHLTL